MKKLYSFYLMSALFLLGACTPFRYAEPQPTRARELSVFPSQVFGLYVNDGGDSVTIAEDFFFIDNEKFALSDADVVLKKKRDLFVISTKSFLKEEDQSKLQGWEVVPAVFRNDSLFLYFLPSVNEEIEKKTFDSISKLTAIEKMKSDDQDYYLIQKHRKAFKKIWKNGVYSEVLGYRKQ